MIIKVTCLLKPRVGR